MNRKSSKKSKKYSAIFIIFTTLVFSFSPIFVVQIKAFPVEDFVTEANTGIIVGTSGTTAGNTTVTTVKETAGDSIAWLVANTILERMTASTVNWINSGFEGSPAYVTDPGSYFTNIGDQLAGQYIFSNPDLNFLCGPISAKIRLALTKSYLNEPNFQCTLTDAFGDMEDFMGDFNKGGWDKFFQMTQKQQNNPLGAFLQAESQLNAQIASRQGIAKDELNWGSGFMSQKVCDSRLPDTVVPEEDWGDGTGVPAYTVPGGCAPGHESTQTPGSVIQDQLNKALGAGTDKLKVADEINEIISALLNQLVSQVVGGVGSGLRGLSDPSPTNQTPTTRQLLQNYTNSTTDYFGNTVNPTSLPTTQSQILVRPIDRDCSSVADVILTSIAIVLKDSFENGTAIPPSINQYSSSGMYAGEDISLIIQNMDCPPAGIL